MCRSRRWRCWSELIGVESTAGQLRATGRLHGKPSNACAPSNLGAVAPLLTLGIFLFLGVMMYVAYRQRKQPSRRPWRNPYMPHPYLWRGAPDWPHTPRPPWPTDEDGNPIDASETNER